MAVRHPTGSVPLEIHDGEWLCKRQGAQLGSVWMVLIGPVYVSLGRLMHGDGACMLARVMVKDRFTY
ncbi:hypothetical protein BDW62DRAFT_187388 [Aspergillus aurantiobrunneus]